MSQRLDDTRRFLLRRLARDAYQQGDFHLKCGFKTTEMVDCSAVLRTRDELLALGRLMSVALEGVRFHGVGGPLTGSDPMAVAMLLQRPGIYWCGVRPQPKGRGIHPGSIVGPLKPGHRILVVEDVMTSGQSALTAVRRVQEAGATVVGVLALVDRWHREPGNAPEVRDLLRDEGVQVGFLFTLDEVRAEYQRQAAKAETWKRYA